MIRRKAAGYALLTHGLEAATLHGTEKNTAGQKRQRQEQLTVLSYGEKKLVATAARSLELA